ncbi:hypothetical protein THUN1379_24720 [Paludibacterium sp. THUN1379]|uniref:hypothetical protein n=1 Tax=Paludibacterium sp. THUN1379 TaxID=3112107 RepID=UPI0030860DC8|nr:hypothetical protein THUN1379_24720 [Paludibacterium sp. THUN1379]
MNKSFLQLTVVVSAVSFLTSCAYNPVTGKPAFDNFQQCMAANTVGAVLGGVAIGTLLNAGGANQQVATGAGVAAAAGGIWLAWRNCAAVYKTTTTSDLHPQTSVPASNSLNISAFSVNNIKQGEELVYRFTYRVNTTDSSHPDINLTESIMMEIPRTTTVANNHSVYADEHGQPLIVDGKMLFVGQKNIPVNRLSYQQMPPVTSNDYVRAGSATLTNKMPMPNDIPKGPYRMTLALDGMGLHSEKTAGFYIR